MGLGPLGQRYLVMDGGVDSCPAARDRAGFPHLSGRGGRAWFDPRHLRAFWLLASALCRL